MLNKYIVFIYIILSVPSIWCMADASITKKSRGDRTGQDSMVKKRRVMHTDERLLIVTRQIKDSLEKQHREKRVWLDKERDLLLRTALATEQSLLQQGSIITEIQYLHAAIRQQKEVIERLLLAQQSIAFTVGEHTDQTRENIGKQTQLLDLISRTLTTGPVPQHYSSHWSSELTATTPFAHAQLSQSQEGHNK